MRSSRSAGTSSRSGAISEALYPGGILPPGTINLRAARRTSTTSTSRSNRGSNTGGSNHGSNTGGSNTSGTRLTYSQRQTLQAWQNENARIARTPLAERLAECQRKLDDMTFKYMTLRGRANQQRLPRPSRLTRWWLSR